jgi:hypothetical protein
LAQPALALLPTFFASTPQILLGGKMDATNSQRFEKSGQKIEKTILSQA